MANLAAEYGFVNGVNDIDVHGVEEGGWGESKGGTYIGSGGIRFGEKTSVESEDEESEDSIVLSVMDAATGSAKQVQYVTALREADVLFGRGSGPNDHEGNIRFRTYVAERKVQYMATSHRLTKTRIAREIVNLVLAENGRFLKRLEPKEALDAGLILPDGTNSHIVYYEVQDDVSVMEKAKQALRQNATKFREEFMSSATSTTSVFHPIAIISTTTELDDLYSSKPEANERDETTFHGSNAYSSTYYNSGENHNNINNLNELNNPNNLRSAPNCDRNSNVDDIPQQLTATSAHLNTPSTVCIQQMGAIYNPYDHVILDSKGNSPTFSEPTSNSRVGQGTMATGIHLDGVTSFNPSTISVNQGMPLDTNTSNALAAETTPLQSLQQRPSDTKNDFSGYKSEICTYNNYQQQNREISELFYNDVSPVPISNVALLSRSQQFLGSVRSSHDQPKYSALQDTESISENQRMLDFVQQVKAIRSQKQLGQEQQHLHQQQSQSNLTFLADSSSFIPSQSHISGTGTYHERPRPRQVLPTTPEPDDMLSYVRQTPRSNIRVQMLPPTSFSTQPSQCLNQAEIKQQQSDITSCETDARRISLTIGEIFGGNARARRFSSSNHENSNLDTMDDLLESMNAMNADGPVARRRTSSIETMGTIEQLGSIADMSCSTFQSSIFTSYGSQLMDSGFIPVAESRRVSRKASIASSISMMSHFTVPEMDEEDHTTFMLHSGEDDISELFHQVRQEVENDFSKEQSSYKELRQQHETLLSPDIVNNRHHSDSINNEKQTSTYSKPTTIPMD